MLSCPVFLRVNFTRKQYIFGTFFLFIETFIILGKSKQAKNRKKIL